MHEMTIAMNVVDAGIKRAQENHALYVTSIELEIGELAGILNDSLLFCFDSVCKNTIAESCKLNIHSVPAIGKCHHCEITFTVESLFAFCPDCSQFQVLIVSGKELKIKSFNYE